MANLVPVPLTIDHVWDLAPRLRKADLDDLTVHNSHPRGALLAALSEPGEAFAVLDGDKVIGAGGWTKAGSVWTLWADLTRGQAKDLIRLSRPWARIIAIRAKRPLQNVYLKGNRATEGWLRATGCVTILDDNPIVWQGREYIPFFLKPLEELPYV